MSDYKLSEGQAWVVMEALETHPIARAINVMRQITPLIVEAVQGKPEAVPAVMAPAPAVDSVT